MKVFALVCFHTFLLLCLQVRFNLLQYVVPDVKELYNWLEVDFHPLKLSGRVTKVNGPEASFFKNK